MKVITNNFYLKYGLESLNGLFFLSKWHDDFLFETRRAGFFLVLHEKYLSLGILNDPILLFASCSKIKIRLVNGRVSLEYIQNNIHSVMFNKKPKITFSEKKVLQKLLEGKTPRYIASMLNISVKTVSAQKINALRKIGFTSFTNFYSEFIYWRHLYEKHIVEG